MTSQQHPPMTSLQSRVQTFMTYDDSHYAPSSSRYDNIYNNIQQQQQHHNLQHGFLDTSQQQQVYQQSTNYPQQHKLSQLQSFQQHQQLQQFYRQQQQMMMMIPRQQLDASEVTSQSEPKTGHNQDGDDDDDDDDTIGHDLEGDDDDEATETTTLEERGSIPGKDERSSHSTKSDLKFNFSIGFPQDLELIENKLSKVQTETETTSKDAKRDLKSLIDKDFDYKHKLILAKKTLSSSSSSPVQSQQGVDSNPPVGDEQQGKEDPISPRMSPQKHLNQATKMGLNIDSSNHMNDGSPVPGTSRPDEDCDLRPMSDEEGESISCERRFRESDEEDEDDDEKSRMPPLLPRGTSLDNRKQRLNEHLLQKYMDTYKSYSVPFNKQEPLEGCQGQPQDLHGHTQTGSFGLDPSLPNFFPFLPHPSLAQQQQRHHQMLVEYTQMKSHKDREVKVERRNVFCCHICSFVGTSEEDFNSHMSQHFEHQCPHCTYSSRTEGRLKRHIKDFHSNENDSAYSGQQKAKSSTPKRTCRYCKFYTYDQVEFWMHLKKHIKPEKLLECPHCEFVTELKHHLEYHIRVHIGSKPFKCPKCNYSCVNKSMLNSHMKSHTNVYQFRCRDCNYATKYSHSLKLHLLKKKHHADVVLNSDGSMPTDGSGQFDVVNRRGPPRGPRLVRSRPGPCYSPNSSSSELAYSHEARRIMNQLDDLRMRFTHDRESLVRAEARQSLSPEMMTASRDGSFLPKSQYNLNKNGLATTFSSYARIFSTQQYDCCFCPEKFPTSMLLKEHVEKAHFKSGFGPYPHQADSYGSTTGIPIFKPYNATKDYSEVLKAKSEPIREGFADSIRQEGSVIPLDLSSGAKRRVTNDGYSRNTISPVSEQGSARKRSRKGRAFKLNTCGSGESKWESEAKLSGVEDSKLTGRTVRSYSENEENDRGDRNGKNNITEKDRPNDLPASSSDDVVIKHSIKTSPQWKNEDAVIENSPKSDLSSEGLIHSNEEQKQVPSSSSSLTFHHDRQTYSDMKVDSNWHICRHCEMAFADQMTHRLHMGYHGYYNPFQCNGCGENCVDAFDFMLHLMCKAHN